MSDEETLAKYRAALEEIAGLTNVKEVRLAPDDTQWTVVDPRTKNGLDYAAAIAKKALQ